MSGIEMLATIAYRLILHYRFHIAAFVAVFGVTTYFEVETAQKYVISALLPCSFAVIDRVRIIRRELILEQHSMRPQPKPVHYERIHRPHVRWLTVLAGIAVAFGVAAVVLAGAAFVVWLFFFFTFHAD